MFAALLLHISLTFSQTALLSNAVRAVAVAEAAAIWAPGGVLVDAGDPSSPIVLTVVASPIAVRAFDRPLGAIVFGADGAPQSRIVLYAQAILDLIRTVRFLGVEESQWPPGLRDRIVGRAVGRVLAHEIGHYVLRSRSHTVDGLMRSFQRADDLVGVSRERFTPAPIDDGVVTRSGTRTAEADSKKESRAGADNAARKAGAPTGAGGHRPR